METPLIGIGGINFRISLPDRSFLIEDSYLPFRVSSVSTMGDWQVIAGPIPDDITRLKSNYRTSRIRDISQSDDKLIFRCWWHPDNPSPWKAAVMEPSCTRGKIWVNRRDEETISYPLFVIDLLLFPYLLLLRGGIIIHAAAVKIGDKAYLFPAPSGGGKSTWSSLLDAYPEGRVLSEDRVIIRKVGEIYQVFGTPWNPRPRYQVPDNAPLMGIYFLQHNKKNLISEISAAETAKKLLQAASLPFQKRDEMDQALTIIEEITKAIPAYQFGFRPDQTAIDLFHAAIHNLSSQ